ncbi:MAG TPA: adenylosuccinate synthase [Candidatus Thermoplasmatota archaeon]|nr:adenylosuccinate synthase [Candidatus Thermoplasmatota archaeon]
MPVTVVVGAQWGDEGKGKVTDFLASAADLVVRYQGGNNAGHTVVVGDQEYKLHLLPSGSVHKGVRNVIGNGVVVDPAVLLQELQGLHARGLRPDVVVSDRAHVILPIHKLLDGAGEDAGAGLGTTRRGIGPAYADKTARFGVRMGDLLDPKALRERLAATLPEKLAVLKHRRGSVPGHDLDALLRDPTPYVDEMAKEYAGHGEALAGRVKDTVELLHEALEENARIVLEGAQGTFLDVDHGTYPYVTSSSTTSGGACIGTGIPPTLVDGVWGIVKAYTTRVGTGPFVTELPHENGPGKHLTEVGREFGTTTGRRRRTGWLDLVLLRRAVQVNGMTSLALTKLDVPGGLPELQVCVAYEVDGKEVDSLPARADALARATPVYETVPGFEPLGKAAVAKAAKEGLGALPAAARRYVELVEERLDVPIEVVGLGPAREHTIDRRVHG